MSPYRKPFFVKSAIMGVTCIGAAIGIIAGSPTGALLGAALGFLIVTVALRVLSTS